MTHPETGRESLHVSPTAIRTIEGLEELVAVLCAHLHDEDRIYHHRWQPGDLVVFNAIGTQHRRDSFPPDQRRYMRQLSTLY